MHTIDANKMEIITEQEQLFETEIPEDIAVIELTKGQYTIVDEDDLDMLSQHKWCAHKGRSGFYAARGIRVPRKTSIYIYMHKEILASTNDNDNDNDRKNQTDHWNGDTLDNRRVNLRPATIAENSRNSTSHKNGTSEYKGVNWYKRYNKYQARIKVNGKSIHLGYFDSEEEAAKAYEEAAKYYFGEFSVFERPKPLDREKIMQGVQNGTIPFIAH